MQARTITEVRIQKESIKTAEQQGTNTDFWDEDLNNMHKNAFGSM